MRGLNVRSAGPDAEVEAVGAGPAGLRRAESVAPRRRGGVEVDRPERADAEGRAAHGAAGWRTGSAATRLPRRA